MLCSHRHPDAAQGLPQRVPRNQLPKRGGSWEPPSLSIWRWQGNDSITNVFPLRVSSLLFLSSEAYSKEVETRPWCKLSHWRPFSTHTRPSGWVFVTEESPDLPSQASLLPWLCRHKHFVDQNASLPGCSCRDVSGRKCPQTPLWPVGGQRSAVSGRLHPRCQPRGEGQTSTWERETCCFQKGSPVVLNLWAL